VVVSGGERDRLAQAVYAPENVGSAALVVAIVGEAGAFDTGRCVQNMMLGAWGDGVVSCPNGIREVDTAEEICGGEVRAIISFGYPARPRDPESRSAEEWSARANRKPLSELVREVG
jgi:nitroreductase